MKVFDCYFFPPDPGILRSAAGDPRHLLFYTRNFKPKKTLFQNGNQETGPLAVQ